MLDKKRKGPIRVRALVKRITIKGSQLACTKQMVGKQTYTATGQKTLPKNLGGCSKFETNWMST